MEGREETVKKVVTEGFMEEVTSKKRIHSSWSLGPSAITSPSQLGTGGPVCPYRLAPRAQWSPVGHVSYVLRPNNYSTTCWLQTASVSGLSGPGIREQVCHKVPARSLS